MKECNKVYKHFEGKKVIILTNSNLMYNTSNLKVLDAGLFFRDRFGKEVLLSFTEIKSIQEKLE